MKLVVTGASGFIGNRLVKMAEDKHEVIKLSLRNNALANIDMHGVSVIIHLAGKAHEMKKDNDQSYFDINYGLTRALAEKALNQGVAHFIYISTTKVYGNETNLVLNEHSVCHPTDAYGKSKLQAEQYLQSINADKMVVSILRPPLVYGPEVKGNMIRLLELSDKNIPLPFGDTQNSRSMVYINNLVELIFRIVDKRMPGVFLASDEKPLSTDDLLILLRKYMNKKPGLIRIPRVIRTLLKIMKPDLHNRLFNSFVINTTETNKLLNFTPPYSTEEGVAKMVAWFKSLK